MERLRHPVVLHAVEETVGGLLAKTGDPVVHETANVVILQGDEV